MLVKLDNFPPWRCYRKTNLQFCYKISSYRNTEEINFHATVSFDKIATSIFEILIPIFQLISVHTPQSKLAKRMMLHSRVRILHPLYCNFALILELSTSAMEFLEKLHTKT